MEWKHGSTTSKLGGYILFPALLGLRDVSRPSTLHHHLDSVTDPKYIGTKISRKHLEEGNTLGTAFVDSPEQSDSTSQFDLSEGRSSEEDVGEEKAMSTGEEDANEDEQLTPRANQDIQENPTHEKDLSTTVRQRRDEDRKKGKAVTKQLVNLVCCRGVTQFTDLSLESLGQLTRRPDTFTKVCHSV